MNPRALLVSPLGFLIGLSLGAVGGGGSILAVPVLVYAAGEDPRVATTTSLFVVGLTAIGGMAAHWRAGRVRWPAGILFAMAGVGGSLTGTRLNQALDEQLLLLAFAGLMVVAAWRMSGRRDAVGLDPATAADGADPGHDVGSVAAPPRPRIDLTVVAKVAAAGTVVGFVTGLFGVGGGFVIVPALVIALGFTMPEAVGTSLLVIAVNAVVALVARVGTGTEIDWAVAAPFTVAGLFGVSVGKSVADRLPSAVLVRWFVALLLIVAAYVGARAGLALLSDGIYP